MAATLTIAIPTLNRADKLERLVRLLQEQLQDPAIVGRVRILISDNGSDDRTSSACAVLASAYGLQVHREERNVGFDRNLRRLYTLARTDYIWYFGDDDLPLPGAVAKVLEALDTTDPDVALFSFIQPLGSDLRQFRFAEPLHVERDPRMIVEHVIRYPKLTIYVLRRLELAPEHWARVDESLDSGWIFVRLAFAVLEASQRPTVTVRSDALASCDDEVEHIDWAPTAMLHMATPLRNEFVGRHAADIVERQVEFGYVSAIQFCMAAKLQTIVPADMGAYDKFIDNLPTRPLLLLKHPRSLAQFTLLKLGLAHLWPSRASRLARHRRSPMNLRRLLRRAYVQVTALTVDPQMVLSKWRALPAFARNLVRYARLNRSDSFALRVAELHYTAYDRYLAAGAVRTHYFHQDLWAARHVRERQVRQHVDVGSRLDGFVAHVLTFAEVEYVDLRPLDATVDGLTVRLGSILDLPYESGSVQSLSCLHVIEHIGLGRYGDPIDPAGHEKAAGELARVLAPGGTLLLGTPVGRERLCFDAHRVFDPATIVGLFRELELAEFSFVDDSGSGICAAGTEEARRCEFGCGLFVFRKPTSGTEPPSRPAGD